MSGLADLPPEEQVLCLAARTRLDDADGRRLNAVLAAGIDWDRLWRLGHRHEVLPLVLTTLTSLQAGAGTAPPADWIAAAQRRRVATLIQNASLLGELTAALATMEAAGVDPMPVKGLVLTEMLYGDVALRPAGDIDILVRPEQLPAAREALRSLGYRQKAWPSYEERHHPFHDPQYFRTGPDDETCLELHWGLAAPRHYSLDTAGLWARSRVVDVFDRRVRVLSPEDTLIHLAVHRARSPLRLRWIVDIAELVRRTDGLDIAFLLRQAHATGARTSLAVALDLAQGLLGAPVPATLMDGLRIGPVKRVLLERTCGVTAMFAAAADDDDRQQPYLIYRNFEQDGAARIVRSLAAALARKGDKWVDRRQPHST